MKNRRILALLGAGLLLGGCSTDKLLTVKDPAVATPESLANPSSLPTLYNGAIGDFQIAYGGQSDGNAEGYNTVSAVMSDEMIDADTYGTRIATDQRQQFVPLNGNTSDVAFRNLQRARHSAAVAAAALKAANAQDPRIAVMRSLEGLTFVTLAEGFCSAIPFSDVVEGVQVLRAPVPQNQAYDSAVVRFDAAIAVDGANNLPKVAKGRALLDKGDFAGAATAVASVPTTYVFMEEHSSNAGRQYNPMYSLANQNGRYSLADKEGVNGLPFRSALDPRVPFARANSAGGLGFDASTPLYVDLRYSAYGSPVVLASGVEARLIEAEAALKANPSDGAWLTKLNDLRSQFATLMPILVPDWKNQIGLTPITARTLAPLTDPGAGLAASDAAIARQNLVFAERAFWLFTTGHRLGDLRRLVRQYGRSESSVFPSGTYFKSGSYGHDVAFPLPYTEQQNPNFKETDCDVTKP